MSSTLRITGGEHRGRRVPLPRGHELRPTSDKARQAFFNIIGEQIVDANFLDLFAGTAIFSFEAVSRGAARAVAVDAARPSAMQITETARTIGVAVEALHSDVFRALKHLPPLAFDVVYADPPFDFQRYDELLRAIDAAPLSSDAVVGLEHSSEKFPFEQSTPSLKLRKTARYGMVAISIFDRSPE